MIFFVYAWYFRVYESISVSEIFRFLGCAFQIILDYSEF